MMQGGMSSPYLAWYAAHVVPMVLVYLVGIVLSIVFWRRYPRAAMFALIAFILGLVDIIGNTLLSLSMSRILMRGGYSTHTMGYAFMVISYVRSLIYVVIWTFILLAIFSPRGEAK